MECREWIDTSCLLFFLTKDTSHFTYIPLVACIGTESLYHFMECYNPIYT
ncbi:hypothetical protein SAMN04487887_11627 [Enterococcus casseliflavus]|nr:hypothetical protein SAMN04487887_11627 [Enterococcus casseliflavus]